MRNAVRAGDLRQSQYPRSGAVAGRKAAIVPVPPALAARLPSRNSASCSARIMRLRTRPGSRKRTSALAGCTLTSTSRGSIATKSATIGCRSRGR